MVGTQTATILRAPLAAITISVYWALLCFVSFAPVDFIMSRHAVLNVMLIGGLPLLALVIVSSRNTLSEAVLAHRDELTGLANRRAFVGQARDHLMNSQPGSVALILLDVDMLKARNDECGHAAGDELLQMAAGHLGELPCSAYRIGGDEFGLVVDRARDESVTGVLRSLEPFTATFESCGHEHPIRLSYGYASCRSGDSFEAVFDRADSRLRQYKHRLYRGGQIPDRRAGKRDDWEDDDLVMGSSAPILSIEERRRRRESSGLKLLG